MWLVGDISRYVKYSEKYAARLRFTGVLCHQCVNQVEHLDINWQKHIRYIKTQRRNAVDAL